MALLTEAQVLGRAQRRTGYLRRSAKDILTEETASALQRFDVFLSHSSAEPDEILLGIKLLLEDRGMSVYVDKYNDADPWATGGHGSDRGHASKANAPVRKPALCAQPALEDIAMDAVGTRVLRWIEGESGHRSRNATDVNPNSEERNTSACTRTSQS